MREFQLGDTITYKNAERNRRCVIERIEGTGERAQLYGHWQYDDEEKDINEGWMHASDSILIEPCYEPPVPIEVDWEEISSKPK